MQMETLLFCMRESIKGSVEGMPSGLIKYIGVAYLNDNLRVCIARDINNPGAIYFWVPLFIQGPCGWIKHNLREDDWVNSVLVLIDDAHQQFAQVLADKYNAYDGGFGGVPRMYHNKVAWALFRCQTMYVEPLQWEKDFAGEVDLRNNNRRRVIDHIRFYLRDVVPEVDVAAVNASITAALSARPTQFPVQQPFSQGKACINAFMMEDTTYIMPEFVQDCLLHGCEGICNYIVKRHFDDAHPANHNIRMLCSKSGRPTIAIYVDGGWRPRKVEDVVESLLQTILPVTAPAAEVCW